MRDLIEAARAELLYLPPYSPDFNPIENAFAKLTAMLRKAAHRTVDGCGRPSERAESGHARSALGVRFQPLGSLVPLRRSHRPSRSRHLATPMVLSCPFRCDHHMTRRKGAKVWDM